ncbi:MAG: hypothetical protein Q4C67_07895 [Deinococcus sp.]|nr:hypothetical protein [Deinococcus sp.]
MTRVHWTEEKQAQAMMLFRRGYSVAQAARKMGVTYSALKNANAKYGLGNVPGDLMPISELAAALGVTPWCAHTIARTHLTPRPFLKCVVVNREAAERLVRQRPNPVTVLDRVPDDHLTQRMLAERWGQPIPTVYRRLEQADVPFVYARPGKCGRFVRCYHLADVEHLRPARPPAGHISEQELTQLVRASGDAIEHLVRAGMPVQRVQCRRYYHPAEVAQWLMARRHPRSRRKGERLLQALGVQP